MQLTTASLISLLALLPHTLGASVHHPRAREHHALAAQHARAAAAVPAEAPKLRRRKTCSRRPSSISSSAAASSVAVSSSASASATSASAAPTSNSVSSSSSASSAAPPPPPSSSAAPPPPPPSSTSSAAPKPTPTPTSTHSSSAAAPTSSAQSGGGGGGGSTPLTPNGNKAGIAGLDSLPFLGDKLGWHYDWTPSPPSGNGGGVAVSMLWGGGESADPVDAKRLQQFAQLPGGEFKYVLGFEEPDCAAGGGSAGMSVQQGAQVWNDYVAHKRVDGTLLGSPSMCHQAAETWLTPFEALISTPWDITNIHINKNSMTGVTADIDYYFNKYKKPIWVSEFACVDDSTSFIPCTDQGEIDSFISDIVDLFEADDRVYAYAYSDGEGLGSVWPTVQNGKLSLSGTAYLNAISKYH